MSAETNPYSYFETIPSKKGLVPCTNMRAAMLIFDETRKLLLLARRSNWPQGWSIIAEHVEEGKTPDEEAMNGLLDETGLDAAALSDFTLTGVMETTDTCRRKGQQHTTYVYEGSTNREVTPNDEAERLIWMPRGFLPLLADRTHAYQSRLITPQQYLQYPGLIPATTQVLNERGLLYSNS
ncbi:MAG: NUDIX hydrolase [Candidatus Levyibacteriota bacterium]